MSDLKIEKGIPLPKRSLKYPFEHMVEGDSFFVPNMTQPLHTPIKTAKSRFGGEWYSKKVREGGVDGVRCWCTKTPDREKVEEDEGE